MTNTQPSGEKGRTAAAGKTRAELVDLVDVAANTLQQLIYASIQDHDEEIAKTGNPFDLLADRHWADVVAYGFALSFITRESPQKIQAAAIKHVRSGQYAADQAVSEAEFNQLLAAVDVLAERECAA